MVRKVKWLVKARMSKPIVSKEPVHLGKCKIETTAEGYFISTTVSAQSWKQADKIAFNRFENCLRAVSIATNIKYQFELDPREIQRMNGKPAKIDYQPPDIFIVVPNFSESPQYHNAKIIHELLRRSGTDDKNITKILDYYLGGLTLEWNAPTQDTWMPEAFLNYFKVVELAAEFYQADLKNELRKLLQTEPAFEVSSFSDREINSLLTMKRKIEFMCRQLEIEADDTSRTLELVDLRNRFDVAHATLGRNISKKDLVKCRDAARLILIKYLGTHSVKRGSYPSGKSRDSK